MTTTLTIDQGKPYLWTNMSQALFAQGTLALDGDGNVVVSLDNYTDFQDGLHIDRISMVLTGTDLSIDTGTNLLTSGSVTSATLYADSSAVASINYGSVFPTADQMNAVLEAWRADPFDLNTALAAENVAIFNDYTVFNGSSGDDIALTGSHDATINVGAGNDYVLAGSGNDQINGGGGNDTIYGDGGNDTIFGGGSAADHQYVDGGDGSDFMVGGAGNDTLVGGDASDFSDDFFVGGAGNDLIIGGTHLHEFNRVQYRYEGGPDGVIVNLSSHDISGVTGVDGQTVTDVAAGTARDTFGDLDTLQFVANVDGTAHADYIVSADEGSDLAGYQGNDTFVAGAGYDSVNYFNETRSGGADDGTKGVIINLSGTALTVTSDMAAATGQLEGTVAASTGLDSYGDTDTFLNGVGGNGFQDIGGTKFDDYLVTAGNPEGPNNGNQLTGYAGNDTLVGAAGVEDTVDYGREVRETDNNGVSGTKGVIVNLTNSDIGGLGDVATGQSATSIAAGHGLDSFGDNDTLVNIDSVDGTPFDDYLVGGTTSFDLEGLAGNDYIDGSQIGVLVHHSAILAGGAGDDTIVGSAFDDDIRPGSAADGGTGDTIDAGSGFDAIDFGNSAGASDHITVDFTAGDAGSGSVSGTYTDRNSDDASTFTGVDSQFRNVERVVGTSGDDTFNAGSGLSFTDNADHDFGPFGRNPGLLEVVGGAGSDTFNDNSGQNGGALMVNYDAEKFADQNFDGNEWGSEAGEHGVIINTSGTSQTAIDFNANGGTISGSGALTVAPGSSSGLEDVTIDSGHAVDISGDTDNLNGVVAFRLTDASDALWAGGSYVSVEAGDGNDLVDASATQNSNISGGAGDDTLIGGSNGNDFSGGAGSDVIVGGAGHDGVHYNNDQDANGNPGTRGVIVNLGNSDITSGIGAATGQTATSIAAGTALDGFGDTDTLTSIEHADGTQYADFLASGGPLVNDNYELIGHGGDDTMVGGAGDTYFQGDAGNDLIVGGSGNNAFVGGSGNDTIDGGTGYNQLRYDQETNGSTDETGTRGVIVNLSDSAVTGIAGVTGQSATSIAAGSAIDSFGDTDTLRHIDEVQGTQFDDYINIGVGNSHAIGGDGNDTLVGGNGLNGESNFFDPGAGDDVVIDTGDGAQEYDNIEYQNATDAITVNKTSRTGGTVDGGASVGHDTFSGIEIVVGTNLDDTFNGSADNDDFTGNAGADTFNGGDGFDTVVYEKEQYGPLGGNINGVIVNLTAGDLAIDDDLRAATGQSAGSVAAGTALDSFGDTDTLNSIEGIITAYKNDYVALGDSSGLVISGAGDDTVVGGAGDDTFVGGSGNDVLDGGAGHNTVDYGREAFGAWAPPGTQGVVVNLQDGTATDSFGNTDTLSNIQGIEGTQYNDYIHGADDAGDELDGGDGNDTIFGGSGNDHIDGGDGSDFLNGGAGDDTLIGGDASDHSDDFFIGGAGNDLLIGGDYANEGNRVQYRWEGGPDGVIVNLSSHDITGGIGGVDGQSATSIAAGTALDTFGYTDTLVHIQNVDGTTLNDYIVSSDEGSNLVGYQGDDTFVGGSGWDDLDYFDETRGNDSDGTRGVVVNLGGAALSVTADIAAATGQDIGAVDAGTGLDSYGDVDTYLSPDWGDGFQAVSGTRFNDYLVGPDNSNGHGSVLTGFAGNDTLVGSGGGDNEVSYQNELRETGNSGVGGTNGVVVNLGTAPLTITAEIAAATNQSEGVVAAGTALDTFGDTDTLVNINDIQGTDFADYIDIGVGNSHVEGGAGDDTLVGGNGSNGESNFFDPGAGNDTIIDTGNGQNEYDNLEYENATDAITVNKTSRTAGTVDGGPSVGHDVFSGIEIVVGTNLADTFNGSSDDDDFTGNAGNDTFNGGAGFDRVVYQKEQYGPLGGTINGVIVNMTTSDMTIGVALQAATGQTADSVAAGHAIDSFGDTDTLYSIESITTAFKNDYVATSNTGSQVQTMAGDDTIVGGAGDDTLTGGEGNDVIDGGAGHDTVRYDQETNGGEEETGTRGVIVNLSSSTLTADFSGVTGQSASYIAAGTALDGFGDTDTLTSIEQVEGTQYNDYLIAGDDGGPNGFNLDGNDGDDTLIGGAGHDNLNGGGGNDLVEGGGLYDYISGSTGNDTIDGGSGGGTDELAFDNDQGHGEDHVDFLLNGTNSSGTVTGTYQGQAITDVFTSIEQLRGTKGADTFTVATTFHNDADANGVYWNGQGDIVAGAGRVVQLTGGEGNDTFTDQTDGTTNGAGSSMVDYDEEKWTHSDGSPGSFNGSQEWGSNLGEHGVIVNLSNSSKTTSFNLNDGSGPQSLTVAAGTAFDTWGDTDTINGITAFRLTDAADVLYSGSGGVVAQAGDGNDLVDASLSSGANLEGDGGNDILVGGAGNDSLDGGLGDDSISGGAGNDQIRDSLGSDTIDGGSGYDALYVEPGNATPGVAGVTFTFDGLHGSGTAVGTATESDERGNTNTGSINTSFSNFELVLGSTGDDQFVLQPGFTNTAEADHETINDLGDTRGSGGDLDVAGGGGNDHFADNSGVEGGMLFVDYRTEAYAHPDYDGHTWGTQPGEHGVVVNLSDNNEGVTFDFNDGHGPVGFVMATDSAIDTFGNTDTFSNVDAVGLTDANDIAFASLHGSTIYGYGGDDFLYGSAGDDFFVGGAGNDTMDGGADGFDQVDYGRESGVHGVFVNLSGTDQSIAAGAVTGIGATTLSSGQAIDSFGGTDHLNLIDGVVGTGYGDVIYGGGLTDPSGTMLGTSLIGLQGNDTLVAAGGFDTLIGGQGNDSLDGGAGSDLVDYGAEASEANGATLNGVIVNMSGASITVAANTVSGIAAAQTVAAGHAIDSFGGTDTLVNIENVHGTSLNDYIVGSSVSNGIDAGAGDDTLASGGGGPDSFTGGAGNDRFIVGAGDQIVVTDFTAGGTDDSVDLTAISGVYSLSDVLSHLDNSGNTTDAAFSFGSTHLTLQGVDWHNLTAADFILNPFVPGVLINGTAGADTIDATHTPAGQPLPGAGNDTILGNAGNDSLSGLAGNDSIDGGAGNDTMIGGTGDDIYVVNATGDVIVENPGEGNDTVQSSITFSLATLANIENVSLTGAGNLNATGNASNNVLIGNTGNNSLDGGAGADTMIGGAGNDTYVVDDPGDTIVENAGEGTDLIQSSITFSLATLSNIENLTLTGTSDINATGNAGNNVIVGNAGSNVIDGGLGADAMSGGAGNDTYYVDNVGDTVTESSATGGTDRVFSSVSFTLGANIENLTLTGSGNTSGTGNTLANIITGNAGDNTLDGGSGADTLIGGGGNDTFKVDNVGDVVTGGTGIDTVISTVTYSIAANPEIENLTLGGTGNINATGNAGNNVLTGNSGNNSLDGGAGADTMTGGAGNDTYVVDDPGDTIIENAGEGTDLVQSSITFSLAALVNIENLTLTGSANINATGNDGNNTIVGNSGNNIIDGGAGADSMTGGAGDDTYYVDNVGDVVVEAAGGGTDTVISSVSRTLSANVENLTLVAGAVTGTGNTLANIITGNAGDNTLDGGAGADTLIGGGGNDTFVVDNVGDVVTGGSGVDTVISTVTYSIAGNPEIENLTLSGAGNINGTGNSGNNILIGTSGNNSLAGGAGDDSIIGGGGNDTLDGGTGNDTMVGGTGNDTYIVDSTGDMVIDAGGTDTIQSSISLSLSGAQVSGGIETLILTGTADLSGTGTTGNDTIIGNSGNNSLDGAAGNDSLVGNAGSDTLQGGTGADTMVGSAGDDTYYVDDAGDVVTEAANAGNDTVHFTGTTGAYTLAANVEALFVDAAGAFSATGNSLANTITGNNDGDTLNGGSGADTMYGGTGSDTFIVDNVGDVVIDAGGSADTISSTVSYTLQAGGGIENLVLGGTGNLAGTGNELANVITGNAGANTLDGGTGADTLIGGAGNDVYYVDNAGDVVDESGGTATDVDTVVSTVSFNLGDGVHALGNIEKLTLSGTDAINGTGNALANTITGNAASNVIDGGVGNDTMIGGLGNDIYYADSVGDVVTEAANAGTDTVHFTGASGTYTLGANVENLILEGTGDTSGVGSSIDNMMLGNAGNNSLSGGAGNDTLDGGAGGNDTLVGGTGDDTYIVRHAGDVVSETGGSGTDTVQSYVSFSLADTTHATGNIENLTLLGADPLSATGNSLANTLIGNAGANSIFGGAGNDMIVGGDGNDTIDGGLGHDSLFGGNGSDVFSYADADFGGTTGTAAANSDSIFDLGTGDSFDFTNLISTGDLALGGASTANINGIVRITGADGSFHIELNEGAALHNQATPDWSDAFDVFGATRDQVHITIGADAYHWDPAANSGAGAFVHDA